MIAPDLDASLPAEFHRVHFIGIGGSGMSGIARMFVERGIAVTGSDRSESATTTALRALGVPVQIGHEPSEVMSADAVVVTGALWADNAEYRWAIDHDIPVVHRAIALNWLLSSARVVSIAGAHGKSTSTAMVIVGLRALHANPSFVNGAVIADLGVSADSGSDPEFVIEADESDGSFLLYPTAVGLVTNIDTDHVDTFGSFAGLEDAFVRFANGCREVAVLGIDDESVAGIRARISTPVVTFGESTAADFRISDIESSPSGVTARIEHRGVVARLELPVPGRHNALNAAGAVAVLVALGHRFDDAVEALRNFTGTGRRFELHDTVRGVRVFDDYAHHPREVRAALATARSVVGEGRVIAIHQPHLYSRTRDMAEEFATEYDAGADFTVVLDVYGAREDPIPGVSGALVADAFAHRDRVAFCPDWSVAARVAAQHAREGDIIMTLSCGDVYRIIPQVVAELSGS